METFASVDLCLMEDCVFSLGLGTIVRRRGLPWFSGVVPYATCLLLTSILGEHEDEGGGCVCLHTRMWIDTQTGVAKGQVREKREQRHSVASAGSVTPFVFLYCILYFSRKERTSPAFEDLQFVL